jgi:hypothetical protein
MSSTWSLCLWRRLRDAQAAGDQQLGSPRMEMGTRLLLNVPEAREMRTRLCLVG